MSKELIKSPVVFDEESHTYSLNGKQLSGITSIIRRYIFPDMYKDVPQAVLEKAAERGTRVHNTIQLWTMGILTAEQQAEIQHFFDAYHEAQLDGWESEYLVSDNTSVASSIDLVCLDPQGNIILCDIKTTSVLHIEYLQWQLSIYAYLFERQNPDFKVHSLKAIHIKKDATNIVDIERLPDEYVEALLNAYRNRDESFNNPLHNIPSDLDGLLQAYTDNERAAIEAKAAVDAFEARKKELQEAIVNCMNASKLNKIDTPLAKVTISADSTKESFDWKAFKESELFQQAQDAYKQYVKTSSVKGRVTITLK